jgi:hypothetical protein
MMVIVSVDMYTDTPCDTGKSVHSARPNSHLPVNDWVGVNGTDKQHICNVVGLFVCTVKNLATLQWRHSIGSNVGFVLT